MSNPETEHDTTHEEVEAPKKRKVKLFPVKLLRNYRPVSSEAQIQDKDGEYRPLTDEESAKLPAGSSIGLPVPEAESVIAKKIAERNDPIA
jgi:hypothetical protein